MDDLFISSYSCDRQRLFNNLSGSRNEQRTAYQPASFHACDPKHTAYQKIGNQLWICQSNGLIDSYWRRSSDRSSREKPIIPRIPGITEDYIISASPEHIARQF